VHIPSPHPATYFIVLIILFIVAGLSGSGVHRFDYLDVLSFDEWMNEIEISDALYEVKDVRVDLGPIRANLIHLQKEGLVTSNVLEGKQVWKRTPKRKPDKKEPTLWSFLFPKPVHAT